LVPTGNHWSVGTAESGISTGTSATGVTVSGSCGRDNSWINLPKRWTTAGLGGTTRRRFVMAVGIRPENTAVAKIKMARRLRRMAQGEWKDLPLWGGRTAIWEPLLSSATAPISDSYACLFDLTRNNSQMPESARVPCFCCIGCTLGKWRVSFSVFVGNFLPGNKLTLDL